MSLSGETTQTSNLKSNPGQTMNMNSAKDSVKLIPHTTSQGQIAILEFDLPGEKANKLSSSVMMRLKEQLQILATSSYKAVLVRSAKPKIFIAGADIDEIKNLTSKEQVDKAVGGGQEIMNMIEDLPMPVIAVVHGACAGGGCELILACDYRIASEASETKIGLPETKLGIIPGFGGCIRLPRTVGLANSLDIILQGKLVNAKKAEKMGLVDKAVHPSILMEQALKMTEDIIKEGKGKRRKKFKAQGAGALLESFVGRPLVFSKAREGVQKATHGHYPAPLKAIDVIAKTYGCGDSAEARSSAMTTEREAFTECALTDISKNLIHVFYLTEMVKKQNGVTGVTVKPKEVTHLGILGAGTMGGGIAYVAADKGIDSRMKDINYEAVGRGLRHASDLWSKLLKRKNITPFEFKQKMSLVTGGIDFSGFGQMNIVVEAIVEDMEVKKKVIAETAKHMKADAIIATNTSSLSVTEMGTAHPHPEYFAGMHFFNPVHKMPLVEVIRGDKTSDETIATIYELSKKMGKMPVVVKDGPGFLVNRLLLPYMGEAAFLMQEGMSIETVDKAYVKEFGMPMGPFELMDAVGLDVCLKVLKIFKKAFGERIELAPLMEKLATSGRLGQKNKKGFYQYGADGRRGEADQTVYADLGLSSPSNPLTTKECIERGVFAMVNECARALVEDKIVSTPDEVDLAMIMGTGFPPFRGGLLKYADSLGVPYIVKQLESYAVKAPKRLSPSSALKQTTNFYK